MKTWRLLATNTLAQVIGKVVTAGSTLVITRLIADTQGLGRDGYGEFSIVTAYAAYFYILTDFGLNAIAVKRIAEDEGRAGYYFGNLLSLRLVMALILIIGGLMVLAFLPYSPALKFGCMIMLLTIVAQAVLTNSNVLFQAKLRYDQSVLASILGAIVSLVLVFLSYQAHAGLFAYLLSMVAGYVVMAGLSVVLASAHTALRLTFDWPLWSDVLREALPLGLTMVCNLAYFKADAFILSIVHFAPQLQLTNAEATGLYNMAYKVFEVILTIPIFFVNALYPLMVKAYHEDFQRFRRLVGRSLFGLIGLSLVGVVSLLWLSPAIIYVVSSGNAQFQPSVQVLRLLSLSLPMFFATNLLLWTIMTFGRQKVLVFFYAISAVINVGLNVWLIPLHGYMAAALTTGITELITGILLAVMVWSLFQQGPRSPSLSSAPLEEAIEVTS